MTTLVRWEPFREMMTLRQAMDRLFEDSFVQASPWYSREELPIEMYQTRDNIVIKAPLPGVKPEQVDINITGDILTIKGEYSEKEEGKDGEGEYLYRELRSGSFSRSVTLPGEVESDKVEAVFENGILTVTLPRAEEVKPKSIKIKTRTTAEKKPEKAEKQS